MKITIDTETNTVKLGRKTFDELDEIAKNVVAYELVDFYKKNLSI